MSWTFVCCAQVNFLSQVSDPNCCLPPIDPITHQDPSSYWMVSAPTPPKYYIHWTFFISYIYTLYIHIIHHIACVTHILLRLLDVYLTLQFLALGLISESNFHPNVQSPTFRQTKVHLKRDLVLQNMFHFLIVLSLYIYSLNIDNFPLIFPAHVHLQKPLQNRGTPMMTGVFLLKNVIFLIFFLKS